MTQIQSFPFLFDSFYRYFGNPLQTKINSFQELLYHIHKNNGIHPCFTTINSFQNQQTIVRTIFNDFDAELKIRCKICGLELKEKDSIRCVCGNTTQFEKEPDDVRITKIAQKIRQAQQLAKTYQEFGIPFVPHFTAKKGMHILPLFKPEKVTDSDLITNLFYHFTNESKCYAKTTIKVCKDCDRTVNESVCVCGCKSFKTQTVKVPYADTVVVSDLRRLIRLPGTKRDTGMYCIAIPPEQFLDMEPIDVFKMAKNPIQSTMVSEPKVKLSEFEFKPPSLDEFQTSKQIYDVNIDSTLSSVPDDVKDFINRMFPQSCLKTKLPTLEPKDDVRYNAVVHLKRIGLPPNEIVNFFSRLGWRDYSYDTTSYRTNNIYNTKGCRFSHKRMKMLGICNMKDCKYRR